LYWLSALIVMAALLGVVWVGFFVHGRVTGARRHEPADKRRRLGVSTQARLATTRDLRPLLTRRPEPGRFVLARRRRRFLSTEAAEFRGRRGVAGAVAVFGPSQSGKTSGLIGGVEAWRGPAIISSVKADLLRATIEARGNVGDVKVFDPVGITKLPAATWSPLRAARTLTGALAAAQILARTTEEGPADKFWRGQAEQLIAAMLWAAANTENQTMSNVVTWVLNLDKPDGENTGVLAPLVRLLTDDADPRVAADARKIQGWLHGQWSTDPRTTASVYATARNAVWPWADPGVANSADGCEITLDWLLAGSNTLYLCAPLGDESRVGVVFAAILGDLITQAFDRYNHTGQPADPRLLVLLDEAANTPLPKLPQWASTVTGAGMQLVTVWQSRAQLDETFGRDAENVLTNHRSKLFYASGLSDTATIDYLSALIGTEHVRADLDERGFTGGPDRFGSRTPATAVPFVTGNILRQMDVGDVLVLHGHLPLAWVHSA
jgi:type IV secretion system protein VirD4